MKKMYWLLSLILISVAFFQCQKEVGFMGGPDVGVPVTPDPITASLQGNITDENGQPAAGVIVAAGTGTAITDANGYFRFTNASLDKNTTLVTAIKEGYFKGYRVFAATSGCNQVAIQLIKKDLAGTVAASSGGEVALSNGSKVNLPANGVVTASSNGVYSGDVKVYASYINPASPAIGKTIPGSLVANNKDGKRVVLSSYGMLAVELSSASGDKLQIKSGSVATLTIPIPASSIASAPATIPLWYVDETTGIWQEEGTATKQGSNYVGTVKHFSYWNCDYQNDAVNVSFTLQTPDGLPLVNAYVEIKPTGSDSSQGGLAHGYTDSLGQVTGLVPANKSLQFSVYNDCYGVAYSQSLSPISKSTDLGIIKVSNATNSILTFKGTLLDCNNNPVSNGYALITINNLKYYASTDAQGKFSTTYVSCSGVSNIATITGVDKDALQQSSDVPIIIALPVTDVGTIVACGNIVEESSISYTLDGATYEITTENRDSVIGYTNGDAQKTTTIYGFQSVNPNVTISFSVQNVETTGTFPVQSLQLNNSYGRVTLKQPFNVTFTGFPSFSDDYYRGSFSGQFIDSSNNVHLIGSQFLVKRN